MKQKSLHKCSSQTFKLCVIRGPISHQHPTQTTKKYAYYLINVLNGIHFHQVLVVNGQTLPSFTDGV